MVSSSTNRCVGCSREVLSTVSGNQCLHCLLDLADSHSDLNQGLADTPTGEAFLANGVLPQFGNYELVAEIARGGMGVVYRAFDRSLNRTVAVKMILAGQLATVESVQRFIVEAKAAARLDHPGIVPIYEIGEYETQHYFSMKLVDGGSLEERMSEFVLPSSATSAESSQRQMEIAGIIRSIASAINSHIHPDLETIVLKCMEKAPSARYASAEIVEDELTRFINGEPILARPVNALEHSLRWCQRNPLVAALLGGLAIVFLGGISGVIWQWQRAESTNAALQASLDRSRWEALVQMTDREENSEVLAKLAHQLRQNPHDWRAAMLATSILDHRRFARPRCAPITHGDKYEFTSATFNATAY